MKMGFKTLGVDEMIILICTASYVVAYALLFCTSPKCNVEDNKKFQSG
jgi:hypothetical protein